MPGPRQPTDVIKANGRKHMTKAEEAERRAAEVTVPPPKKATPPKWLGQCFDDKTAKTLKAEFRKIGKQLIDVGLYTDLDADTLAQYLVSRHQWELATQYAEKAMQTGHEEDADTWGRIQNRYFSAARHCAAEMGLSVSSRCKLVIPSGLTGSQAPPEEDEFTKALLARQRAAGSA